MKDKLEITEINVSLNPVLKNFIDLLRLSSDNVSSRLQKVLEGGNIDDMLGHASGLIDIIKEMYGAIPELERITKDLETQKKIVDEIWAKYREPEK